MKQITANLLFFTFLLLLTSCAATYKHINPSTLNYPANSIESGVKLSVKYDVLSYRGNKKYAKREQKRGIKVVAVQIFNLTDSIIQVGRDLAFFVGQEPMMMMDPDEIASKIKQSTLAYLPYMFLIFVQLDYWISTSSGTSTGTFPIGYALGPGMTIGNMAVASSANKQLNNELNDYDIMNRSIQKGESIYGIIGFRSLEYVPISVKIRN